MDDIVAFDMRLSENRNHRPDGTKAGEDGFNMMLSSMAADGYHVAGTLGEFVIIFQRNAHLAPNEV